MPASETRQPIHPYCGSDKARQEIGLPGHCDRCCLEGHVEAHPDLGCGDVGCNRSHEPLGDLSPLRYWPPNGHELARMQISKHGRDRYPTAGAQYAKVLDELGELGEALITHGTSPVTFETRREYADAGLALYELGNKLGIDLIEEMHKLVAADERKF